MTSFFQQTGVLVCERCGQPADSGEDRCVTEQDFASDGYPEPVGTHPRFVFLERPAAPLILPLGVLMAEREREMAVLAEALESEQRVVDEYDLECGNCGEGVHSASAIVVKDGFNASEVRCLDCQPNDETESRVTFEELSENAAIQRAELIDAGRRILGGSFR